MSFGGRWCYPQLNGPEGWCCKKCWGARDRKNLFYCITDSCFWKSFSKYYSEFLIVIIVLEFRTVQLNSNKSQHRSSHQRWSIKQAVLKKLATFTGKQMFLINLQAFKPAALSKRSSNISVFLWKLQKF